MAKVEDGKSYMIMNIGSKTVVDLENGNPTNGTQIWGWEFNVKGFGPDQKNQIWKARLEHVDSNGQWFSFCNQAGGTAIDNSAGKATNKNKIQGWQYQPGNYNQQWLAYQVRKGEIPVYTLYNRAVFDKDHSWSVIDLDGGNPANGTLIFLFDAAKSGTNNNQMWLFIEVQ